MCSPPGLLRLFTLYPSAEACWWWWWWWRACVQGSTMLAVSDIILLLLDIPPRRMEAAITLYLHKQSADSRASLTLSTLHCKGDSVVKDK